ncbi:MAG: DUF2894 domain-containing protein [Gammaproteobacteria bacterium]
MSDDGHHAPPPPGSACAQDADRTASLHRHFVEAMRRRATRHAGEARRLLDARLATLAATDADRRDPPGPEAGTPEAPDHAPLRGLLDHIARQTSATDPTAGAADDPSTRSTYPDLAALDEFRQLWSKVHAETQVRQSLEQAPANAGPLNSGRLVHRSLNLMRELSPAYLRRFLAHVDALSWLEQINVPPVQAKDAAPVPGARKRARNPRSP